MQLKHRWIALGVAALAVVVAFGCGNVPPTADPKEAADKETTAQPKAADVEYLFVHGAESTTLADGVLRLGNVNPATIYFSDRPERIAGHLPTQEFVANWGTGDDSFASNPPNATLSILTGPEPQEIVLVLTEPRLEGSDLVYTVTILEGAEAAEGGASSVFIDIIGRPLTPLSFAGEERRVRRRALL